MNSAASFAPAAVEGKDSPTLIAAHQFNGACQTAPHVAGGIATTRTVVNASSTGTYRTSHQAVRPGADQHRQYASRGVRT